MSFKHIALTSTVLAALLATPALAQDHGAHHHVPAPSKETPDASKLPADPKAPSTQAAPDHGHGDHSQMDHSKMDPSLHAGSAMGQSALGSYPMGRDASGTAWQVDDTPHEGVHQMTDSGWMFMHHATLNLSATDEGGPRGNSKTFVSGMWMSSARKDLSATDSVQFRVMASPDPFMGKSGYPLLLQTGETANGKTPLMDRQHPHDLLMELSASYSKRLSATQSVFLYAGLPGEPAFGPAAFMHRMAGVDSPLAPISHHWLDSGHITWGVVTAGYVHDRLKFEISGFKGREPDQKRFDIEQPKLDSLSARLSYNPTPNWALQVSYADITSPEQLAPKDNVTKWSASALYGRTLGNGDRVDATFAFGRKRSEHVKKDLDAYVIEASYRPKALPITLFTRAEQVASNELVLGAGHHDDGGAPQRVQRLSLGGVYDIKLRDHLLLGIGYVHSFITPSEALKASYGRAPQGRTVFLRLKLS